MNSTAAASFKKPSSGKPLATVEACPRASRAASVRLTRSIAAESKQLLKQQLGFCGYRIGELYPRRTRRATAVNWLLADLARRGDSLPASGPLPPLLPPPDDPVQGHPGDLLVG